MAECTLYKFYLRVKFCLTLRIFIENKHGNVDIFRFFFENCKKFKKFDFFYSKNREKQRKDYFIAIKFINDSPDLTYSIFSFQWSNEISFFLQKKSLFIAQKELSDTTICLLP